MELILEFVARWEWLLLLGVGVLEALILWKIYQENRERAILIGEMRSTRIELGRESYLAMIKDALANAKHQVFFVSHSLTSNMTEHEKASIFKLYHSGLDHRCITGRHPGKVREMWEQHRHGVKLRVNDLFLESTFRYHICDGHVAILGFAGESDEASVKGTLIDSIYFSHVLQQHFLDTWDNSQPFLDYVREILTQPRSTELASSLSEISTEWGLYPGEQQLVQQLLTPHSETSMANEEIK